MTQQQYYYATGKRKSSIAKVRLYPGKGSVTINGKPMVEALPWQSWQKMVEEPFKATDTAKSFDVVASVKGGGVVGQADAVKYGIAKALLVADPNLRGVLKRKGLLTRDAREKESKKYGLVRARKAKQYSKR